MDFNKLSWFVLAFGILVVAVGGFKVVQNQPLPPPPPSPKTQFSWTDFANQMSDPTQNALGVRMLNQDRAKRREAAAMIVGFGAVIVFAGIALKASATRASKRRTDMEPRGAQLPTNKSRFTQIGLIAGVILGYPLSYFFQPGALRSKISLGGYIQHFFDVIGDKNLLSSVVLGFVVAIGVCMAAGFVIGQALDQNR